MTLEQQLAANHLTVLGGFHAKADDYLPAGTRTLLLLGPSEPGFWPHVTAQREWVDGTPDPIDRWSRRTIGTIACSLGAKALFPFGGPPYHPFYRWALQSGCCWDSPVKLLVHASQGLMVSFRGALALRELVDLPAPTVKPCDTCAAKPCVTACPPAALTADGYDVPACHAFLDTDAGTGCMTGGCLTRRACPVSQGYARLGDQSAYHMRRFHGVKTPR